MADATANEEQTMKKMLVSILISSFLILPTSLPAGVNVSVGIALPPLIVFAGPPAVVVIPGTYVYAIPDVEAEIFFHVGWWWRFWDGRWYRSRYYDRDWLYFRYVPRFYYEIDPGWREYYTHRHWHGHPWQYERIPVHRVQQNWNTWQKNRYWEKQKNWGVQNFQPRPYSQPPDAGPRRQEQYQDRRDSQRMQPQREQRQREQREQRPQRLEQYQDRGDSQRMQRQREQREQRPQRYLQNRETRGSGPQQLSQGELQNQRSQFSLPERNDRPRHVQSGGQYHGRHAEPREQRRHGKSL